MTTVAPGQADDLSPLDGAYVVLGVCGGIAAYKAVEVCRRLVDAGAHVAPVMTEAAKRFVGEATFSALASAPVVSSLFIPGDPIPHTRLGRAADLVVVVPATARVIGEYASGISADVLVATLLATTAPVLVCPAMHTEMWQHAAVRDNLRTLGTRGVGIVEPETGRLAGGDVGEGRLADPAEIVRRCAAALAPRRDLGGVSVVVTAGGTREPIDPVRYVSNRSSGKQGYALAARAARRGAIVTLISTVDLPAPFGGVRVVAVETADQMLEAVLAEFDAADVVIMAAAVADFRPKGAAEVKLRRRDGPPELAFEATPDILAALTLRRSEHQVLVGFAAETGDAPGGAAAKLADKALDLIVANDVSAPGVGFGHDTNAVTILDRRGGRRDVALAPKAEVADAVLDAVVAWRSAPRA